VKWNSQELQQLQPRAEQLWITSDLADLVPAPVDCGDYSDFSIPDFDFSSTINLDYDFTDMAMPANVSAKRTNDHFGGGNASEVAATGNDMFSSKPYYQGIGNTPYPTPSSIPNISPHIGTAISAFENFDTGAGSATTMTPSFSGNSSPKKRSSPTESLSPQDHDERTNKRQKNTEAARRYRQRKVDRVTELEEALAAMTKERDDLKLKLARSEAEADVLRGMVGK
jgi:hypothetical protein